MLIPIFHKDNPYGMTVDLSLVDLYKTKGWVDSPDKLNIQKPIPEPVKKEEEKISTIVEEQIKEIDSPLSAVVNQELLDSIEKELIMCSRGCGELKHKGFCRKKVLTEVVDG